MAADRVIKMTSGKQFTKSIKVKDAKKIWSNSSQIQVLAQMRTGKTTKDSLISNLHDFMKWEFQGNDLVILWSMLPGETISIGEKTWGQLKRGYFNLVLSDVGVNEQRSLVVPTITVQYLFSTTKIGG